MCDSREAVAPFIRLQHRAPPVVPDPLLVMRPVRVSTKHSPTRRPKTFDHLILSVLTLRAGPPSCNPQLLSSCKPHLSIAKHPPCQARGFGRTGHYWEDSSWASQRLLGRLPARYGWESCTVHTAELHSLLCALRFRVPGRWHLLVFDRSSLFQVMHSALRGTLHQLLHSSCCTLVLLLRRVLKQLEQAWDGTCPLPAWKLHQQHYPELPHSLRSHRAGRPRY